VQPEILDILLRKVYVDFMDRGAGFSWCGECDMDRQGSLAFIFHFFNNFYTASSLVCSFCEAVPESPSGANTAVLSANVAVVDSVEVGRSVVYSRYNRRSRTLSWGKTALNSAKQYCLFSTASFVFCTIRCVCSVVECLSLKPN
jgi:hypothetical protein